MASENVVYLLNLGSSMRDSAKIFEEQSLDGSELPKTKIGAVLDVLKLYICFCMESRKRDEFCFCFGGVNIDGDDMINELSKESRVFSRPAKTLLQYLEKVQTYCQDSSRSSSCSNFDILGDTIAALGYLTARNKSKKNTLKKIVIITDGIGTVDQDSSSSMNTITEKIAELDCALEICLIEPGLSLTDSCIGTRKFIQGLSSVKSEVKSEASGGDTSAGTHETVISRLMILNKLNTKVST